MTKLSCWTVCSTNVGVSIVNAEGTDSHLSHGIKFRKGSDKEYFFLELKRNLQPVWATDASIDRTGSNAASLPPLGCGLPDKVQEILWLFPTVFVKAAVGNLDEGGIFVEHAGPFCVSGGDQLARKMSKNYESAKVSEVEEHITLKYEIKKRLGKGVSHFLSLHLTENYRNLFRNTPHLLWVVVLASCVPAH